MAAPIVQWVLFLAASALFLVGAVFNGMIGWRTWIRDESDGPSVAPLLFGLVGIVAVLLAPFGELSDRWAWIWLPLLLDYGTGPYFLMVAYYLAFKRTPGE